MIHPALDQKQGSVLKALSAKNFVDTKTNTNTKTSSKTKLGTRVARSPTSNHSTISTISRNTTSTSPNAILKRHQKFLDSVVSVPVSRRSMFRENNSINNTSSSNNNNNNNSKPSNSSSSDNHPSPRPSRNRRPSSDREPALPLPTEKKGRGKRRGAKALPLRELPRAREPSPKNHPRLRPALHPTPPRLPSRQKTPRRWFAANRPEILPLPPARTRGPRAVPRS